jgi:hypothetical protein
VVNGTSCDDGVACTDAVCQSGACVFSDHTGQITVNLKVQAVAFAVTRFVTFNITTCGGSVDTRAVPVSLSETFGQGSAVLNNIDVGAEWFSAQEGHTLRRMAPLSFVSCAATVDMGGPNLLLTGDFSKGAVPQDNLNDITDFSILAANWNTTIEPTVSAGADATADGVQWTDDFTAIQPNFLTAGDAVDACPGGAHDGIVRIIGVDGVQVRTPTYAVAEPLRAIAVDSLPFPGAERADLNSDGVVDAADVRAFARLHGLFLTPEFQRKLDPPRDARVKPRRRRDAR